MTLILKVTLKQEKALTADSGLAMWRPTRSATPGTAMARAGFL